MIQIDQSRPPYVLSLERDVGLWGLVRQCTMLEGESSPGGCEGGSNEMGTQMMFRRIEQSREAAR